eukprot:Gb_25538 [translate_table: standard]
MPESQKCRELTVQRLELSKSRASVLASLLVSYLSALFYSLKCISTVGDAFFFLGSRLGDSLLVQFNCGVISSSSSLKPVKDEFISIVNDDNVSFGSVYFSRFPSKKVTCQHAFSDSEDSSNQQVGDIEGEVPAAKRLRRASSDISQDVVSGEELSLYNSTPSNSDLPQVG